MESGSKILDRYSFKTKAAKSKIEKILAALSSQTLCRRQLAEIAHVNHRHIKNYIDYLLDTKQVYICEWKFELQGQRVMQWPYYKAGDKKSKPKPASMSIAEKCKRYRKKLKTDDDRLEKINLKRRARRRIIKPDWTASWMMVSNSTQTNDAGA